MYRLIALVIISLVLNDILLATDRYFNDITEYSPSTQYRVEALSEDNRPGKVRKRRAFQVNFSYTCTDTETGRELWTRKQPMGEPFIFQGMAFPVSKEPSPVAITISDDGWTAIRTASDSLVFVDPDGRDHGPAELLENGISEEDQDRYVQHSMAGPYWAMFSLWYFLRVEEKRLFVVRPWWGNHVVMDTEAGRILPVMSDDIQAAIRAFEIEFVISQLGDENLRGDDEHVPFDTQTAAYLAGLLNIREAISLLRQVEKSNCWGSVGGRGLTDDYEGDINPLYYATLRTRQAAQLSLRRLGEVPSDLPCHLFFDASGEPHSLSKLAKPRHMSIDRIIIGMKTKAVLAEIGAPDDVMRDAWHYDMDTDEPFTLVLDWKENHVSKITRELPAVWTKGTRRDESLIH